MTDIKKTLITSALPYINGIKHLGNLAGSLCRPTFMPATGAKLATTCCSSAQPTSMGRRRSLQLPKPVSPSPFTALNSTEFRRIFTVDFGISFDHFGRSSSPQNRALTQHFFKSLDDRGFIEERTLNQVYSLDDGRFLPDRYIVGTCPHCGPTAPAATNARTARGCWSRPT